MIVLTLVLAVLIGAVCFVAYWSNALYNPYKLVMCFGKKGCGKSTLIAKLAHKYNKKGWTVYTTMYCKGCYHVNYKDIGRYELVDYKDNKVPKILLLIDEVNMIWDNRDYKSFPPEVRDWFIQQRKHHVLCYLFSQTFTCDKKLRDLTDEMWLLTKFLNCFSYAKRISKYMTIKDSQDDDCSQLSEGMQFDSVLGAFFGTRMLTFIPRWIKYFDTDEVLKELPYKKFELW